VTRRPRRARPAALAPVALALLARGLALAQAAPAWEATTRAIAGEAAAFVDAWAGGAAPAAWPSALSDLVQRVAPPEPMDYYWSRGDAVVEEALRAHRPDRLAGWRAAATLRRAAATRALLAAFREALERYALDRGRYPAAVPGLADLVVGSAEGGPYLGIGYPREDGWGRPLVYRPEGPGYELFSAGPDGREATPDDIR
jgi:hypothetical protein